MINIVEHLRHAQVMHLHVLQRFGCKGIVGDLFGFLVKNVESELISEKNFARAQGCFI